MLNIQFSRNSEILFEELLKDQPIRNEIKIFNEQLAVIKLLQVAQIVLGIATLLLFGLCGLIPALISGAGLLAARYLEPAPPKLEWVHRLEQELQNSLLQSQTTLKNMQGLEERISDGERLLEQQIQTLETAQQELAQLRQL
jgi:hypothetical protein